MDEDLRKKNHNYMIEYVESRQSKTLRTSVEGLTGNQLVLDLKHKVAEKLSLDPESFSLRQDSYNL